MNKFTCHTVVMDVKSNYGDQNRFFLFQVVCVFVSAMKLGINMGVNGELLCFGAST